ncbi:GATA transcription factor 1 [Rhodamnia argentea]|uniref:GATA transcription factor 1 n=1 Tax=Rhodamnia argentea TaxID=178133 RepID=A0A8B8PIR8_9MYRT|nr:GATA transcription factor 1 [Rhodamnia argentea]
MESLGFMEDLLDFTDLGEVVDEEDDPGKSSSKAAVASLPDSASFDDSTPSVPECGEEELEWILNKDAFPSLESFVDILPDQPGNIFKDDGLIPVLENSSSSSSTTTSTNSTSNRSGRTTIVSCCGGPHVPVRARSKRARSRRCGEFAVFSAARSCRDQEKASKKAKLGQGGVKIGRKCLHCGSEKTPQWRAGPQGPKTLCNACGVRFKSGRLVPEYRPASSPTFSSNLHSNSHRKIIEMRKVKQMGAGLKGVDMRVK